MHLIPRFSKVARGIAMGGISVYIPPKSVNLTRRRRRRPRRVPAAGAARRRAPLSRLHRAAVPRPAAAALRRLGQPGLDAAGPRPGRRRLPAAVARPRPVRPGHLRVGERHAAVRRRRRGRRRRRRRLDVESLFEQPRSLLQLYTHHRCSKRLFKAQFCLSTETNVSS